MNAQEILENLAKLESNLQNIDSARKQVETLSISYEATKKQLHDVASEITSIVNDLNIIFKAIKGNHELTSREIDTKVGVVISNLNGKINSIQTEIDSIKTKFTEDCTSVSTKLQSSANLSIERINSGIDTILSSLNKNAQEQINKISATVQSFQAATANALTDHKLSMQSISSKFNDDIKTHVSSFNETKRGLDSVLEASKDQSEVLLRKISNEITKVNTALGEYETRITQKVDKILVTSKEESTALSTIVTEELRKVNVSLKEESTTLSTKVTEEFNKVNASLKEYDRKINNTLNNNQSTIISKIDSIETNITENRKQTDSSHNMLTTQLSSNHKLLILLILIGIATLVFNIATLLI